VATLAAASTAVSPDTRSSSSVPSDASEAGHDSGSGIRAWGSAPAQRQRCTPFRWPASAWRTNAMFSSIWMPGSSWQCRFANANNGLLDECSPGSRPRHALRESHPGCVESLDEHRVVGREQLGEGGPVRVGTPSEKEVHQVRRRTSSAMSKEERSSRSSW